MGELGETVSVGSDGWIASFLSVTQGRDFRNAASSSFAVLNLRNMPRMPKKPDTERTAHTAPRIG